MVQDKSGKSVTWAPVNAEREPVAPSKPSLPTTGSIPRVPVPIDGEDGEVIAPVEQPSTDEVMPAPGANPWQPADGDAPATSADAIRELGDSAVRSASLSASGAPTPLGGVPQVTSFEPENKPGAVRPGWVAGDPRNNAPESASQWSATTPHEGSPETPVSPASPASAPSTDSAPTPDQPDDATEVMSPVPTFGDEGPAYEPQVPAASADAPSAQSADGSDGALPPQDEASGDKKPTPWYAGAPFLVVVGLLVLGGIGFAVYQAFFTAEDVTLTPEVLIEAPAEAAGDPITLEDPTDFLAAMPGTVGAYVMTDATPVDPEEAGLSVTPAEVNDVTYSDGTSEFAVRSIQHFNEEDATDQYAALSEGGSDPQPVSVGGAEVGERVTLEGDPTSYMWRNGTAVFELTGPADQIESFYGQFPL
ncbi:hypothetical protein [Demequina flava]|uniref:hypothetical protein n=1 Tax=Demequina flava TaxID=1095025 RepID=UPI000780D152|nr:hypothetical protein [Demequina flava]